MSREVYTIPGPREERGVLAARGSTALSPRPAGAGEQIEHRGASAMKTPSRAVPGFVNAHTHVYSALAPYGMPAGRIDRRTS